MLNIAITFDYELFLGKNNGSDDEILFNPTEKLMNLLEKYSLTSTFFADVCSVEAHRKFGQNTYIDQFEKQLCEMQSRGHDVQLHLHPNWLLSTYVNNQWNFDTTHYTLQSFGFDQNQLPNAVSIIKIGKEYLEHLLQTKNKDYRCVAYRAGGYSVQPHDKLFEALRAEGILIDSSVCSNLYSLSSTINYDFRNLPRLSNWWITPGHEFSYCGKASENGLYEVSLPSQRNSLLKRLFDADYVKTVKTEPNKGEFISMPGTALKHSGIVKRILNYNQTYMRLSFDAMNSNRMIPFLYKLEKKYRNQNAYIAIVCHPKIIDDGILSDMEAVFKAISFDKRFRFVNMRGIYDEICGQIINEGTTNESE